MPHTTYLSSPLPLPAVKEVFAITPDFRLVSPSIAGGVATISTTLGGYPPEKGIDMRADPSNSTADLAHGSCPPTGTSDWWRVDFFPTPLASMVFVNRGDGGAYAPARPRWSGQRSHVPLRPSVCLRLSHRPG